MLGGAEEAGSVHHPTTISLQSTLFSVSGRKKFWLIYVKSQGKEW
jgi:hypothetical protein